MTEQARRRGWNRRIILRLAGWVFVILFLIVLIANDYRLAMLEINVETLAEESRIDRAEIQLLKDRVDWISTNGVDGKSLPLDYMVVSAEIAELRMRIVELEERMARYGR